MSQVCQIGGVCTSTGAGETTCRMECGDLYDTRYKLQLVCTNNKWEAKSGSKCVPLAPTDFSYASNDLELMQNKAMNEVVAYIKCAECEFLVKDADLGATLPEGINIDSVNGTLYGTPTKLQDRAGYTLVARNEITAVETVVYIKVVEGVDSQCEVGEYCTQKTESCQRECGEGYDSRYNQTLICISYSWQVKPGSSCIPEHALSDFKLVLVIVLIAFVIGLLIGMVVCCLKRKLSHGHIMRKKKSMLSS